MFADGMSKGMSDCFAENLPGDLATAPLAVIKRLERLRKAVEIIGKAGSIYAIYEDIKAYDPAADPYETGMAGQTHLRRERSSRGGKAQEERRCEETGAYWLSTESNR